MASLTLLDTHVVAWLYAGATERFPDRARERLDRDELAVSPVVGLELQYLYEIGRVTEPAERVLDALAGSVGLAVADRGVAELVDRAVGLDWTRDPFDRLLAAHALAADAPLLTADRDLREHLPLAVWEG